MPNGVHAAMESMQTTSGKSPSDRTLRIAKRPLQLPNGDDAMLAPGHLRQGTMRRSGGAR